MATPGISAKLDTTRFDRDFALYMEQTSKTLVDAVNYKLYDATRAAIKGTDKADRGKILDSLNATSNKYPKRTVAEMIVIKLSHYTGREIQDLEQEAKELTGKRLSSIGFTKAGWIPALKKLLPAAGRETVTVSGVVRAAFGGADLARRIGSEIMGSTFNDVRGTKNEAFVESLKEKGAQAGIDKVSADMEIYLEKKLGIPAERFNRA